MEIIGYVFNGFRRLPDPNLLTHIKYAFAELYVRDNVYQKFELIGQDYDELKRVVELKKINPKLKVSISFTSQIMNQDNIQDGGFSQLCNSKEQRQHFCNDVKQFLKEFNLDGVDFNWEFPTLTWSGQKPLADDKSNFDLLIQELKACLSKDKIISYAGHAWGNNYFHDNLLLNVVNHVNIMCYDMGAGILGKEHNAIKSRHMCIEKTLNSYNVNGNLKHKIMIGIPLYGRVQYRTKRISNNYPCTISITEIEKRLKNNDYSILKTNEKDVPFLMHNGKKICTFEDVDSLFYKIKLIHERELGGLMLWDISADTEEYKYLKIINKIVKNISKT
jgi:chitinase